MLPDHQVRGGDGVALGAVCGAGVGEFDVGGDVVGGQHPRPVPGWGDNSGKVAGDSAFRGDKQATAPADRGDDPGVAVGHVQVGMVAAGDNPVPDTDPLPGRGDHHPAVVDPALGDQPVADRGVELGDLLAGVDHDRYLLAGGVRGRGVDGQRLPQRVGVGVQPDLAAGEQGIERLAGIVASRVARVRSA